MKKSDIIFIILILFIYENYLNAAAADDQKPTMFRANYSHIKEVLLGSLAQKPVISIQAITNNKVAMLGLNSACIEIWDLEEYRCVNCLNSKVKISSMLLLPKKNPYY